MENCSWHVTFPVVELLFFQETFGVDWDLKAKETLSLGMVSQVSVGANALHSL